MSKHADGSVYCDYINCHLIIVRADRSQLNFVKADYHGPCFLAERRKQKTAVENPRPGFVTAALFVLLILIAFHAPAQEPKHVQIDCKGDRGMSEYGSSKLGIRCSAVNLQGLPRRWIAYDAEDASKPFYASFQDSFFFPAGEAWMVVELRVDDAVQTHYLRARARRFNGKPEFKPFAE